MSVIDSWLDIVRREAQNVAFHGQTKSTLICTSYNPDTHAIKGILMPAEIETGWVPLAAIHAGNGYGILVGPKVGSADALDGDQFDIQFEFGDPNSPMAVHRRFSTPDKPPPVQSGEMLIQHDSGNKLFFDQNKQITIAHYAKNGTMVWDKDGHLTFNTNGGNLNLNSGGGQVNINS